MLEVNKVELNSFLKSSKINDDSLIGIISDLSSKKRVERHVRLDDGSQSEYLFKNSDKGIYCTVNNYDGLGGLRYSDCFLMGNAPIGVTLAARSYAELESCNICNLTIAAAAALSTIKQTERRVVLEWIGR